MSVMPGTRLGPYEISARLGAGEMVEVYRATDAKLGREVAIKVLPAEVPGDTERLARCEREAKLLAALDHPNIAHTTASRARRFPPAHFQGLRGGSASGSSAELSQSPALVHTGPQASVGRTRE